MAYQFLYCADGVGYFLNPKTLEEISLPLNIVNENLCKVLEGGIDVKVRMNGDKAIYVHSSNRLYRCTIGKILEKRESTVVKVLIGINYVVQDRPSTVVQVQGGAKVNCPGLFEIGDQIMVMIDDLSYQGKPLG